MTLSVVHVQLITKKTGHLLTYKYDFYFVPQIEQVVPKLLGLLLSEVGRLTLVVPVNLTLQGIV